MSELNPKHPVTQEMHDLWHKMVAVLLWKHCNGRDTITEADMNGFMEAHPAANVIFHAHKTTVDLTIVTEEEGRRLMAEEEAKGGVAFG